MPENEFLKVAPADLYGATSSRCIGRHAKTTSTLPAAEREALPLRLPFRANPDYLASRSSPSFRSRPTHTGICLTKRSRLRQRRADLAFDRCGSPAGRSCRWHRYPHGVYRVRRLPLVALSIAESALVTEPSPFTSPSRRPIVAWAIAKVFEAPSVTLFSVTVMYWALQVTFLKFTMKRWGSLPSIMLLCTLPQLVVTPPTLASGLLKINWSVNWTLEPPLRSSTPCVPASGKSTSKVPCVPCAFCEVAVVSCNAVAQLPLRASAKSSSSTLDAIAAATILPSGCSATAPAPPLTPEPKHLQGKEE